MAQQISAEDSFGISELGLAVSETDDLDELQRLSTAQHERSWQALLRHLDAADELSRAIRELHRVETSEKLNIEGLAAHRAAVLDARAAVDRTVLSYFGATYRERIAEAALQGRPDRARELVKSFDRTLEDRRSFL